MGVGCDERGPFPGVGGRGASGESIGAGMDVPSVREKLMGVSVRGWYLVPAISKKSGEVVLVRQSTAAIWMARPAMARRNN
jgi:hypothetical protein